MWRKLNAAMGWWQLDQRFDDAAAAAADDDGGDGGEGHSSRSRWVAKGLNNTISLPHIVPSLFIRSVVGGSQRLSPRG